MTIQQLVKTCHKNAKDKGFWDSNSHNIPEKLMLIVSELGEALEALREGKRQPNKENADELNTKTGKLNVHGLKILLKMKYVMLLYV